MNRGRYQSASEMYSMVLDACPNHWKAQISKVVLLFRNGENEKAKNALKEALKTAERTEVHDRIACLKQLQKRLKGEWINIGKENHIIVEPSKFKAAEDTTTLRSELANAFDIREFQNITRLNRCDVELIKKQKNENYIPMSYSDSSLSEKSVGKRSLERILHGLLNFLKPETFVEAVKAINQRILSVLCEPLSDKVDLGLFFVVVAPLCGGPPDRHKRVAYHTLLWRPGNEGSTKIRKIDAQRYIQLLRTIYIPSHGVSETLHIINDETDTWMIWLTEFLALFDDPQWGFGIMYTLLKLETRDRHRNGIYICASCRCAIIGSRFKEMKSHFSLCSQCYSEGKVPSTCSQEEYIFEEYDTPLDK